MALFLANSLELFGIKLLFNHKKFDSHACSF